MFYEESFLRLDDNIGDLCYSSSSADSVQIAKVLYLQKVKGEPIDRLHSSDDDYCPCPTKNTRSWAAGGRMGAQLLTSSQRVNQLWMLWNCGRSSRGRCWGRWWLLGLANFGVALGKLEPDRLGQIGIETDTLLQEEIGQLFDLPSEIKGHNKISRWWSFCRSISDGLIIK